MPARSVGGIRSKSGKAPPRAFEACTTRAEEERLRIAMHDRGAVKDGKKPVKKPNVRKDAWMPDFLAVLRRSGSEIRAAKSVRVSIRAICYKKAKLRKFQRGVAEAHRIFEVRQILKKHPRLAELTAEHIAYLVRSIRGESRPKKRQTSAPVNGS